LINVPRINSSVLGVYENTFANGSLYGIGAGVTYVGERLGETRTQAEADASVRAFELPAYTTAKLVAYWRINPRLRVSLDVDNLLDETYYSSSVSRLWVTPGTGRTLTLGLQTKF
ncbi:MAG TPA: TonB-dependent receptor, partial [Pseudoxanthomonas sp.]|nr:TonB-dependent receptor [Pseudoxanthomonas sp.]